MIQFHPRYGSAVGPKALLRERNPRQVERRVGAGGFVLLGLLLLGVMLATTGAQAEAGQSGSRIDLNRATAEQLADLPGIGAAKAAAIIEHRSTNGAFESVEELEAVRGIGPALVAKLRPLVTLGNRGGSKGPAESAKSSAKKSAK